MRFAGTSGLLPLLALSIARGQAQASCYDNTVLIDEAAMLKDGFAGSIASLCDIALQSKDSEVIAYTVGNLAFSISRRDTSQSVDGCRPAFDSIVSQCISGVHAVGGELSDEHGVLYKVSQPGIEARSPVKGKPKTSKPQTKPQPKPQVPAPKPVPKPQSPTPPPAKPPVNQASKTSSALAPLKTKNCKQIYKDLLAEAERASVLSRRQEFRASHDGFVGSRVQIEKRASSKSAKACGLEVSALPYPDSDNMKKMPVKAKYYGYAKPDVCDVFGMSASQSPAGNDPLSYEVEHVLEWQIVTRFFDWIEKNKLKSNLDHPDRDSKNKKGVKFCTYFKETWAGSYLTEFSVDGPNGVKRTALKHLAAAYPANGADHYQEEFVWLQKTINAPAKKEMFSDKTTVGIFAAKKMTDDIKGKETGRGKNKQRTAPEIDKAKAQLMRLKYAMGVRKYLRNPAIAAIFKKQKLRMEEMLGKIDKELAKNPQNQPGKPNRFAAWQVRGLDKWWDEYMEERFNAASSRLNHDMAEYLPLFEKEWLPRVSHAYPALTAFQKDIRDVIAAWKAEKAVKWVAPWN